MITFSTFGANGQLGNQLFQYAFLRAASLRNSVELVIPKNNAYKTSSIYDVFDIETKNYENVPTSWVRVVQKEFHYTNKYSEMVGSGIDIDFCGYFQSEKFFDDFSRDIRQDLKFKSFVHKDGDKVWNSVVSSGAPVCSIHVRRGDYVGKEQWHPIQPISYYETAVKFFPGHQFLVFSDDIKWCQDSMSNLPVTFISGTKDYQDMYLMSKCDAHIIVNSSFSWWGAWLADSKKVVAPKTWFGPSYAHYITKDICPSSWLII